MQISELHIKEFQDLFFKKHGFEIDKSLALKELISLVSLMDAVYRHQNKHNYVRDKTLLTE
jgi:hypothetical protein